MGIGPGFGEQGLACGLFHPLVGQVKGALHKPIIQVMGQPQIRFGLLKGDQRRGTVGEKLDGHAILQTLGCEGRENANREFPGKKQPKA
jgi:hypothetical protein